MKKDTVKLTEELALCADFRTFYNENRTSLISEPLSKLLARLLDKKGLTRYRAIRRSELPESYGYQIFSGVRVPERNKLLALAVGMELSVEETQSLLQCAGYAPLYIKIPFDSIVLYGISHQLAIPQINALLYQYGFQTLG